jgi:cell division protein ZipA
VHELRLALLGLGALFIALLGLWEWRRPRHRAENSDLNAAPEATSVGRREPSIDEFAVQAPAALIPDISGMNAAPIRVEISRETAVDVPGESESIRATRAPIVEVGIRWPPAETERVLSLRLIGRLEKPLNGRRLRQSLQGAGMRHGPQQIFHRTNEEGDVLVSAANLVRPGSFDVASMDGESFRGVSLFCVLPGPVAAEQMLDGLVTLARQLAGKIEAAVQDERGQELDAERLTQLRRSLHPEAGEEGGA